VRKKSLRLLNTVCRTGTHLFEFIDYVDSLRGWGKSLREAVSNWYLSKSSKALAYQVVKYRQRGGWSHLDVLRLAHPTAEDELNDILHWVVKGWESIGPDAPSDEGLKLLWDFERLNRAENVKQVISILQSSDLPWEALDSKWLKDVEVWETLIPKLPLTALIRNLGRMTSIGALKPFSSLLSTVNTKLTDADYLMKSRVHPISVLIALKTYASGCGFKGELTWEPLTKIRETLNDAFYLSFRNVEPMNKKVLIGLDVSDSMSYSAMRGSSLTCAEVAAAMSLSVAKTERDYHIMAFCDEFVPLDISPKDDLVSVLLKTTEQNFGSTDCALPMIWARKKKVGEIGAFIVITDNETWAGEERVSVALNEYRSKFGINSKLVVAAMTATKFSIADPKDPNSLDVVGFDAAVPNVISSFVRDV